MNTRGNIVTSVEDANENLTAGVHEIYFDLAYKANKFSIYFMILMVFVLFY